MSSIGSRIALAAFAFAFMGAACSEVSPNDLFSVAPFDAERRDAEDDSEACPTCSGDGASANDGPTGDDVDARDVYDGGPGDAPSVDVVADVVADVVDAGTPVAETGGLDRVDAPMPVDAAIQDVQQMDRPLCISDCDSRRVFVTAKPLPNGAFGSVSAADAFCQSSADSRRLGGTWKAWISDTADTPLTRFTRITGPYRLLDGTIVAMGWKGLTSGKLLHAIDMTDARNPVSSGENMEVWTGTTPSGTTTDATCANWRNGSSAPPHADVGLVGRVDSQWTQAYQQFCHLQNHLLCFEQ